MSLQTWPMRISTSFGNHVLLDTNTDVMPIPRIGELLEIQTDQYPNHYIKITKIEYFFDPKGQMERCIYVIGNVI